MPKSEDKSLKKNWISACTKIFVHDKRGKSNLTVEKPDRHYLTQIIRVNITSDKTHQHYVTLASCTGRSQALLL